MVFEIELNTIGIQRLKMTYKNNQGFAAILLAYNQEDYIEQCVREIANHCGAIFIMYSAVPFTFYNPNAREEFSRQDSTSSILAKLKQEYSNLHIIEGEWSKEDDMRNDGRAAALAAGFEYLLIIDADEFFPKDCLPNIQESIENNPDTDSWWCKIRVPYKYINYVIDREDEYLPIAIRLNDDITFVNRRVPSGRRLKLDDCFICFNMGFVLSDDRMLEKTRTYGHAHQLPVNWYKEKWLGWCPDTKNLHTRKPELWPATRVFSPEQLPAALRNTLPTHTT